MSESFGARLRQRRECQQIALATISEQTKIKLSLLEALEQDDVSRWPSGIFRRAFIRAYAHAISLDPDVVVREFLERHPDPIELVEPFSSITPEIDPSSLGDGPPTRFRYVVGAAVDRLLGRTIQPRRSPVVETLTAANGTTEKEAVPFKPDLMAAARLCTQLGQVDETSAAAQLLHQAVGILDAVGLIVWAWDSQTNELTPLLAHGYSEKVLAQLPRVTREDDNATAAAFRSLQTTVVNGSRLASGALVVPLMTPAGCVGVLAIELKQDSARTETVRALATFFAAPLARLVEVAQSAQAVGRKLA